MVVDFLFCVCVFSHASVCPSILYYLTVHLIDEVHDYKIIMLITHETVEDYY